MPVSALSLPTQAIVVAIALLFAITALTVGLYLMPSTFPLTFLKRIVVVGVIAPFGMLLTIGWIGLLIWASTYSIVYLGPSLIAIVAATSGLCLLSFWVCQPEDLPVRRRGRETR